jgi:hypothetical protein
LKESADITTRYPRAEPCCSVGAFKSGLEEKMQHAKVNRHMQKDGTRCCMKNIMCRRKFEKLSQTGLMIDAYGVCSVVMWSLSH